MSSYVCDEHSVERITAHPKREYDHRGMIHSTSSRTDNQLSFSHTSSLQVTLYIKNAHRIALQIINSFSLAITHTPAHHSKARHISESRLNTQHQKPPEGPCLLAQMHLLHPHSGNQPAAARPPPPISCPPAPPSPWNPPHTRLSKRRRID